MYRLAKRLQPFNLRDLACIRDTVLVREQLPESLLSGVDPDFDPYGAMDVDTPPGPPPQPQPNPRRRGAVIEFERWRRPSTSGSSRFPASGEAQLI